MENKTVTMHDTPAYKAGKTTRDKVRVYFWGGDHLAREGEYGTSNVGDLQDMVRDIRNWCSQ